MRNWLVVLSLFISLPTIATEPESSYVFSSSLFQQLEAEKLEAIEQLIADFNKRRYNRKVFALINYSQTEKSQIEVAEEIQQLQDKLMESLDLGAADTIDILTIYYSNFFEIQEESEDLIVSKNYFIIPQSTHMQTIPRVEDVMATYGSHLNLEEFVDVYLQSYNAAPEINTSLPDFAPLLVSIDAIDDGLQDISDEGTCAFSHDNATIDIPLQIFGLDNFRLTAIEGVKVEYTKNCNSNDLIAADFRWNGQVEIFAGDLSFTISNIDLTVAERQIQEGEIMMIVRAQNQLNLGGGFSVGRGLQASIKVKYLEGKMDLDWIDSKGLACRWKPKGGTALDISLAGPDEDGLARFSLDQRKMNLEAAGFSASKVNLLLEGTLSLSNFEVDITQAVLDGKFVLGTPQGNLSLDAEVAYDQEKELLVGVLKKTDGKILGLELESESIFLEMDTDLSVVSLSGDMKVKKHADLKQKNFALAVENFRYEKDSLRELSLSGQATGSVGRYEVSFEVLEAFLRDDHLDINIQVIAGSGDYQSDVQAQAKIYADSVVFEEVAMALNPPPFGPIQVKVAGKHLPASSNDPDWNRFEDLSMTFMLATTEGKIDSVTATGSFELHRSDPNRFRNVQLRVDTIAANLRPTISINGNEASLVFAELQIDEAGNVAGSINFDVERSLKDDKSIVLKKDLLTLDSYSGRLTYEFAGKRSLEGRFILQSLTNVKATLLRKEESGNKILATLTDGSIDESGSLTGVFTLFDNSPVDLKIKELEMSLESLSLEVVIENAMNAINNPQDTSAINVSLLSGSGRVELRKIPKMEGTLAVSLAVEGDSIGFEFESANQLKAFGFELDSIDVRGSFDLDFRLRSFDGKMRAKHTKIDGYLTVSSLKLEQGELKHLRMRGRALLAGCEMIVNNASYNSKDNLIDVSAVIKFPTEPNQREENMSEIGLERFLITTDGEIQKIDLHGKIHRDPFHLNIKGHYDDSTFTARFDTELFNNKFCGDVSLGSTTDKGRRFNYFYLWGSAEVGQAGIPLGPTGIFLNKLQGSIGYNYSYDFTNYTDSAGNPSYDSYTASFGVGVKSTAFRTSGRLGLSFGPQKQQYYASADFAIPGNSPVLTAKGDIVYTIEGEEETVSGKLSSTLQLPRGSGDLLDLSADLEYYSDKEGWELGSDTENPIRGRIAGKIDFFGNLILGAKSVSRTSFDGSVNGLLRFKDSFTDTLSVLGQFDLIPFLSFNVQSEGHSKFDNTAVSVTLEGCISSQFTAKVIEKNTKLSMTGRLRIDGGAKYEMSGEKHLIIAGGKLMISIDGINENLDLNRSISYDFRDSKMALSDSYFGSSSCY